MDSLRYWVQDMHVDGFRFDLASTLARELYEVDRLGAFFDIIHQDPMLSQVKLIAEPWDVGDRRLSGGQFSGALERMERHVPRHVRRFWKGDEGTAARARHAAERQQRSLQKRRPKALRQHQFHHLPRRVHAQDLVSYNEKHNEANGENNQDGANDNNSWNCGAEGPTDDLGINALRAQQRRNFMTTLLLSAGVPMLLAGDEFGHSQQGNNNTYCQDNDLTWLNWDFSHEQQAFLEFVRQVIAVRRAEPVFQRRKFFQGRHAEGADLPDISWFQPSGEEMSDEAWGAGFSQCLGVRFPGDLIGDVNERGEPIVGHSMVLLINAHHEAIPFTLPFRGEPQDWERLIDTADPSAEPAVFPGGEPYTIQGRAMVVLRSNVPTKSANLSPRRQASASNVQDSFPGSWADGVS